MSFDHHSRHAGTEPRPASSPAHPPVALVEGAPAEMSPSLPDADLRHALSGAWIQALYQPIVRMHDRRPMALEVLARLHHPDHGVMPPELFVTPMEDAGLAGQLAGAVLARVFDDWTDHQLDRLGLRLAINLPLDLFLMPDALQRIDEARAAAGLRAGQLIIELTETTPLSRLPELSAATGHLRNLGYGLAIDDVGPHVRDHSALLAMKFTMLKLDKDLVRDAARDASALIFLTTAIAAARQAGIDVTAEGIEDEDDWSRMQGLGVDFAQGFLVSHPMAIQNVATWHRAWCERFGYQEHDDRASHRRA
jgi:EAL domain-containing protein (putative c-di-GMP-specific phosphodiesterase class I)